MFLAIHNEIQGHESGDFYFYFLILIFGNHDPSQENEKCP